MIEAHCEARKFAKFGISNHTTTQVMSISQFNKLFYMLTIRCKHVKETHTSVNPSPPFSFRSAVLDNEGFG